MRDGASKILFSGFSFWVVIGLLGAYYLSPVFLAREGESKPLKFGIDLVGGTYLSLLVDVDKAVEDELYERMEHLRSEFKEARIEAPASSRVEKNSIIFTFETVDAARAASMHLRGEAAELKQEQDGNILRLTMPPHVVKRIHLWAVESNIKVLKHRVDKFSVEDVPVVAQGDRGIIVEMPNIDNPEVAKARIGKAAQLEIKLVEREAMTEDDILDEFDGDLPDGMIIVPGRRDTGGGYYLLPRYTNITGRLLRDAHPDFGQRGYEVVFEFSSEGGSRFHDLTSRNIGRRIAIVLDGEVISAPEVHTAIRSRGSITGNFSEFSAKELADLLKSGAYVAPVSFDLERHVGPSLGAEAIEKGLLSCVVGLLLLLLFSLFYYKIPGLFAFMALIYNLLVSMLALAWFKATLTLPGIAGMVLTVGMAIDASVLIYEKIKEELDAGLTWKRAVDSGFRGATTVILDGNITTLIVGLVLLKFGTGPIQGFAVTMIIGIIATLITGIFFLRSMFNLMDLFGVERMRL